MGRRAYLPIPQNQQVCLSFLPLDILTLTLNTSSSVHGEYRFSSLPMPPPSKAESGRLTGEDLSNYLESFTSHFLAGKIRYGTEVLNVRRQRTGDTSASAWKVRVRDLVKSTEEDLFFDKIVLCSGVSMPFHPRFMFHAYCDIGLERSLNSYCYPSVSA